MLSIRVTILIWSAANGANRAENCDYTSIIVVTNPIINGCDRGVDGGCAICTTRHVGTQSGVAKCLTVMQDVTL